MQSGELGGAVIFQSAPAMSALLRSALIYRLILLTECCAHSILHTQIKDQRIKHKFGIRQPPIYSCLCSICPDLRIHAAASNTLLLAQAGITIRNGRLAAVWGVELETKVAEGYNHGEGRFHI